jgi:RimJ/RimL family protein N-acetyltransferase
MIKYNALLSAHYRLGDLSIKTIDDSQIQKIRIWRNQQMDILRQNHFITEECQIQYFQDKIFPLFESSTPVQVLFYCYYEEKLIGYGGIVHISYENKIGEISFLLDPKIPTDQFYESIFILFLELMDKIAFQELRLNKLFTETFSTRMEHVSILEKAGYIREGIRQSHVILNGKVADIYLHGKLAISRN